METSQKTTWRFLRNLPTRTHPSDKNTALQPKLRSMGKMRFPVMEASRPHKNIMLMATLRNAVGNRSTVIVDMTVKEFLITAM